MGARGPGPARARMAHALAPRGGMALALAPALALALALALAPGAPGALAKRVGAGGVPAAGDEVDWMGAATLDEVRARN